jgi:hypothetical protein
MGLGNFAQGFADSRNNRVANKRQSEQTSALSKVLSNKANPAEGVGGTPVTDTGKEIKSGDKDFVGPVQAKSLGSKIGQGIKSGVRNMLGFSKGGRITKSGVAFVHKGETIIPGSKERKPLRMSTRRSGSR